MVIQDQGQVSSLVQLGKQRGDPSGKIGEDEDLTLLLEDLFQHCGVWLFQTEAPDSISLPFECAGEYGARSKPIGIIVVKDLDSLLRHLPDFPNGMFHRVNQDIQQ